MSADKQFMPRTIPILCGSFSTNPNPLTAAMHNGGYQALNLPFVYVSFGVKETRKVVESIRSLGIRGGGISMPHKLKIVKYLDKVDSTALEIGAVNTVVNNDGILTGYNTDWIGAVNALEEVTTLKGKTSLVIGAGGVARGIIYGLSKNKSRVVLYNRSVTQGKKVARMFNVEFGGDLTNLEKIKDYDILINATSVGLNNPDESIVPSSVLKKGKIVLDVIVMPYSTKLIQVAKLKGCKVVLGLTMMLHQGAEQFRLYTGKEAPYQAMERAIKRGLLIK